MTLLAILLNVAIAKMGAGIGAGIAAIGAGHQHLQRCRIAARRVAGGCDGRRH